MHVDHHLDHHLDLRLADQRRAELESLAAEHRLARGLLACRRAARRARARAAAHRLGRALSAPVTPLVGRHPSPRPAGPSGCPCPG